MQQFSVADAKNKLSRLIEEVESGEEIVITRRGEPVALLTRPPTRRQEPRFGLGIGKIRFKKGWDSPMTGKDLKNFLGE